VYEFTFTPPTPGVYYAMVKVPSLRVKQNQLPYLMVQATAQQSSEDGPEGKLQPETR
jgi:hypothetical protein